MVFPSYPGPFVTSASSLWNDVLAMGVKRTFTPNRVILHPEEECRFLYYVETGEILTTHFATTRDSFKVNIIGENAVAGIFEMFAPSRPNASWRTLSPTVCYLFSKECVENDLPRSLLLSLLEQSAFMGVAMAGRFVQGLNKRNDVRLARFLLHFAEFFPVKNGAQAGATGVTVIPGITQEISSELLGMHLITFNKLLAAFRRSGIIGKSKQSGLEILDMQTLAEYAEGTMPPLGS